MTVSRPQQQRDMAVLQLLSTLPTHAYDLERQLLAMGVWWSRKGGVHRHLKGLQAQGLATHIWEIPAQGRPRLVYSITEAGMAYLQRVTVPRWILTARCSRRVLLPNTEQLVSPMSQW